MNGLRRSPRSRAKSSSPCAGSSSWSTPHQAQLDLERHGGRNPNGVLTLLLQRLLALTARIWHNDKAGQRALRSLVTFDHC